MKGEPLMIKEMKQLKMLEERKGIKVPVPNFFYVERYGRKLEEQMESIFSVLGKKEYFLFHTDCRFKEGGLLHNFLIELERHADLGKEFEGCVLIEISEDILQEEEFDGFLTYLKSLEDKIYFLFTIKQTKNTALIQECMEQYFFIRVIWAEVYSVSEQWEKIRKICEEYRFDMEKAAEEYIKAELEKKEWKEEEQVMCRLQNVVYSIVYENRMEGSLLEIADEEESQNKKKTVFSLEMVQKMLKKLESEQKKRKAIGFCVQEIDCA